MESGWSAPSGREAIWNANLGRRSFLALPQATMALGLWPVAPENASTGVGGDLGLRPAGQSINSSSEYALKERLRTSGVATV